MARQADKRKANAVQKMKRDQAKLKKQNKTESSLANTVAKIGSARNFNHVNNRRLFIELLDKHQGDILEACKEFPCKPHSLYVFLAEDTTDFHHEVLRRVQINTALYHSQGHFYRFQVVLENLKTSYDLCMTGQMTAHDHANFIKYSNEHSKLVHEDVDNVFTGDVVFNIKQLVGKTSDDVFSTETYDNASTNDVPKDENKAKQGILSDLENKCKEKEDETE